MHDSAERSSGARTACDQLTIAADLEYEIDIADGRTLRLHARCHTAWHDAAHGMTN
jgi:hypothetical protein